ncbi:hypothetical protein PAXRUDRAFT_158104 [Paxillus rubicundulus Ve08.2h10]|uniref:Uncharacterized protein n=1 Tax=Paxillus rubicundulus Ve08.2h10 TaxID=930991 RepID=A0A0D0D9X2_9AGAM|nr:hypothetical protein PAXRUDRAFT_158104 [Paxillus rubicundulus Ve08.2h10]
MSIQQLTISLPDLSQSNLHMGLYYLGFQIESALLYLIHQPNEYWPDNWQQLLNREFVNSYINMIHLYQFLHAMQQIHATHMTTAIPAPAVQGIYHISCKNLPMALQAFDMQNCNMSVNIPTFLHNWDLMLVDNFQGKWWDNNAEHNGNQEAYGIQADALTSRHKYFQASIIIFRAK